MSQVQQSRSSRTTIHRAAPRRDPDAPVSRRRRGPARAEPPTRVETRYQEPAHASALDEIDMDAILGESLPEADAPVPTKRQKATAVPASTEVPSAEEVRSRGWKSWRAMFEDGLLCQVQAILAEHRIADLVDVAIDGARVTLRGEVPDELTSQLVEDLAWSVPSVRQCENQLRVTRAA